MNIARSLRSAVTASAGPETGKLRVLDLFSGIGGFSLGLERTGGFETVAFCEIEEFPRRVLAKHWPGVPIHRDVRELKAEHVGAVDVICGGFPCQDISTAGKGAGLAGERSGLWSEYARLVGELRPRYVIVENVAALLGRGLGVVLGDLAALGYDAEWHCIPASAAGAPHIRDRLWIIAYPQHPDADSIGPYRTEGNAGPTERSHEQGRYSGSLRALLADTKKLQRHGGGVHPRSRGEGSVAVSESGISGGAVPDADSFRFSPSRAQPHGADGIKGRGMPSASGWWGVEPDVGRVAHGAPARVDRLRGLGNAVVPQIPEIIGRAILAAEGHAHGLPEPSAARHG